MTTIGTVTAPTAPGAVPGFGHALQMKRDPLGLLLRLPEHGDLVRLRFGPVHALVVCDPDLFRQVMLNPRIFDKGGFLYQRFTDMTGNNVGTCPYPDHRRYRRLTQPAFHPSRLPGYTEAMAARIDEFVRGRHDGETVEITPAMMRLTASVAVATMFGAGLTSQAVDTAVTSLRLLIAGLYRRMFLPPVLDHAPLPANRQCARALRNLRAVIDSVISEHRARHTDQGDLLSMLLAGQRDPDGTRYEPMTDREISDQILGFFVAGTETTAAALAWALDLIGRHPDIDHDLAAEARAVLGDGPVHHGHLAHLTLTRQVVTETLRLYPPPWILTRYVTEDTTLGGYHLPRGTTVVLSPYLLHRRPDLFAHPDAFDPHRPEILSHHPHGSLLPFGIGSRKCMGDDFAMTLAPLALAAIAARWSLTHVDAAPTRPAAGMLLTPRDLRMTVHRRTAGRAQVA